MKNWISIQKLPLKMVSLHLLNGLGTIGKTLVKLVKGFNFNILAFDLYQDELFEINYGVNYCNLDTLLSKSDRILKWSDLKD